MRIAHVSTFPPLKCGIAFFARDLVEALLNFENVRYSLHYGKGSPSDAIADADLNSPTEVAALAKKISDSDCDVLCLQHEFGIWGGSYGENLLPFLDRLNKPLLSVLHTTFLPNIRSKGQCRLLERLITQSARVVLLTDEAKRTTEILIGRPIGHAVVIPHGVPRFPYREPPPLAVKERNSPLRLITLGFFREDKGLEVVLKALAVLRSKGHHVRYLLAGKAQSQFPGQATYLEKLLQLISELRLSDIVVADTRCLSVADQIAAIQSCHLGVFAYQDPSHSSSGTVPLVLSAGRPVVCTPFEYAREKGREGHASFLADGFAPENVSDVIERIIVCKDYLPLTKQTYARTSHWAWPNVAARFEQELRSIVEGPSVRNDRLPTVHAVP